MTSRQWENPGARAPEVSQENRVVSIGVRCAGQLLQDLHAVDHLPRAGGILVEEVRQCLDGGRTSLRRFLSYLGLDDRIVRLHVRNLDTDQSQRDTLLDEHFADALADTVGEIVLFGAE